MSAMRHPGSRVTFLAAVLLAGSVLAGCGSSTSNSGASPSSAASTSPTAVSSTGVSATDASSTGVPLTPSGTKLTVGGAATVRWSPKQKVTGTLRIKVTQLQSTTYKQTFAGWKLDPRTASRTPYFVRADVTNLGGAKVGGYAVPLYGLSSANELVEASSFSSAFQPCQPGLLPKKFPKGATASVCLVVLVPNHGRLVGVSYRPTAKVQPITWSGKPKPYTQPKPKKGAKKGATGGAKG